MIQKVFGSKRGCQKRGRLGIYKPGNGVLVLFGVNGTERLVAGVPARPVTVCISALPSLLVHGWFYSLDQAFLSPCYSRLPYSLSHRGTQALIFLK